VKEMTINERLKLLRNHLNLTTRAFGASINMSGGAITNMEKGTRNITDRTIHDICREYGVRLDWFINGTKPIFEDITSNLNIDDDVKQLVQQYILLNDDDQELIKKMINSLAEKKMLNKSKLKLTSKSSINSKDEISATQELPIETPNYYKRGWEMTDEEIEEDVAEYRRELLLEKNMAEKSQTSKQQKYVQKDKRNTA